jgi:hypothetical protein
MLLESINFKTQDGRKNEKWIKMDLTCSSPGPFMFTVHQRSIMYVCFIYKFELKI